MRLNGTVSYLNRYGSELSKTESLRIEKELNDIKIELAGVVKETILGNMVIEKKLTNQEQFLPSAISLLT